jgi:WD40 repeat protein
VIALQDTLHLATGCQDGLLRIFDVCQPASPPLEFKVSANPTEGISKIAWSVAEPDFVFVGKKSGVIEKWDTRTSGVASPVASVSIPGGENIMDFEQSAAHNVLMVASGKKVCHLACRVGSASALDAICVNCCNSPKADHGRNPGLLCSLVSD